MTRSSSPSTSDNASNALAPGDAFWIVIGEPNAFWPSYLDWSLNFQFSRWRTKNEPDLAPELKAILLEEEVPQIPPPKTNPNQCLIAAKHLLPCDYVNFFSCRTEDLPAWLPQAAQIWRGLQKPSTRIFVDHQAPKSLASEVQRFFEGISLKLITEQSLPSNRP